MANENNSDTITFGELLVSAAKMSDSLRPDTKRTLIINASFADGATAPAKVIATGREGSGSDRRNSLINR